jgi:GT2 family glycosyltransferase
MERIVAEGATISGYVPFYNNAATVLDAIRSLRHQEPPLDEIFAVDDGSSDQGPAILERAGFRVVPQPSNLGRGAARDRALRETAADLVVSCDATAVLPPDFVQRLLHWFADPKVAGVYGRVRDPAPNGAVSRWRARHLFKAGHPMGLRHHAPLITFGTILRRSAVLQVGGFDSRRRHSEDADLGERLLSGGYDIVFDPSVPVLCNVRNSLFEVLERYWRWYAGKDESVSWKGYWRNVVYSIKAMAWQDLRAGDPSAALISLLCPHYQFWRTMSRSRLTARP